MRYETPPTTRGRPSTGPHSSVVEREFFRGSIPTPSWGGVWGVWGVCVCPTPLHLASSNPDDAGRCGGSTFEPSQREVTTQPLGEGTSLGPRNRGAASVSLPPTLMLRSELCCKRVHQFPMNRRPISLRFADPIRSPPDVTHSRASHLVTSTSDEHIHNHNVCITW
jgi:hypothetical protein